MSNYSNYLNLSEEQTELLKYLHSQITETQTQLNSEISRLSIWIQAKEEENADMKNVIDYEINKAKQSITSLRCRFDYLVKQLNNAETTYEFISKI